eukprot:240251_1
MRCQTQSLRLGTCIRKKVFNKSYMECIKSNCNLFGHSQWLFSTTQHNTSPTESLTHPIINPPNNSNATHSFTYEIRLGPVVANIPTETLQLLTQQCSDQCTITKTRNAKALYIQSSDHDDITAFQSLIHQQFLQFNTEPPLMRVIKPDLLAVQNLAICVNFNANPKRLSI